jgi:hypothetical protein
LPALAWKNEILWVCDIRELTQSADATAAESAEIAGQSKEFDPELRECGDFQGSISPGKALS